MAGIPLSHKVREELGKLVRETWISYCKETGNTKPSHIAPWVEIDEWDKEADRRIGETIWNAAFDSLLNGLIEWDRS